MYLCVCMVCKVCDILQSYLQGTIDFQNVDTVLGSEMLWKKHFKYRLFPFFMM